MPTKQVEPAHLPDALAAPRSAWEDAKRRARRKNKADNLDLLWAVLIEIREAGGKDYSLSEVGRRLEVKGGPKTQSLRNAGGQDFRTIITTFAHSVMGSSKYVAKTKSGVDLALDLVGDTSVRAVLQEAIVIAKKYRAENDMLRNIISRLSIPSVAEMQACADPVEANVPAGRSVLSETLPAEPISTRPSDGMLNEELLEALQKGISKASLRRNGWKIHDDGSVWNREYELFPTGFVAACEKVLIIHGKEVS